MTKPPKPAKSQKERFIEAARNAGASEDETAFNEAVKKVAKPKPKDEAKKD